MAFLRVLVHTALTHTTDVCLSRPCLSRPCLSRIRQQPELSITVEWF